MKCKCTICKRKFDYGDHISPMFNEYIWHKILKFYNLIEWEKLAHQKFEQKYTRGSDEFKYEEHTFICYLCAEEALGRTIKHSDLNVYIFNKPFIKFYF